MRWAVILLLTAFVASQIPGSFGANANPATGCDRWIIAIIPVPDDCSYTTPVPSCQPPEGWEPVSGVIYGEAGKSGVLLRRCIEK